MSVRATNWAWEIGRTRELGQGKLLTLLKIADHADQDGVCWPGEAHLADYTVQGGRTVRRHLSALEDEKLVHRERTAKAGGRGRAYDKIFLHLDQPAKLAGEKSDDQPATDDRLTGQSKHDQPATDDISLYREPSVEPSGTVCTADPAVLPVSVSDPLSEAATAKEAILDPAAVRRACEAYPDRDHVAEAQKFATWHLHGDGRNAPVRQIAQGFRNWLKRSAPAKGSRALAAFSQPTQSAGPVVETKKATAAWAAGKQLLEKQVKNSGVWIAPLEVAGEREGKLVLVDTSDQGAGPWVMRKYRALVLEAVDGFDDLEIVDETQLELEAA